MKKILDTLEVTDNERIGYITLNRPDKRNALNPVMVNELISVLEGFSQDPAVKVVVLRANGNSFCAGADLQTLQQMQQATFEENLEDSMRLKSLFQLLYEFPKIVIAQVQGHALAGGCGLASVCDFIFSVPEAKYGYTEVKIGFIPAIVLCFLTKKIGEARSRDLLLSGRIISAAEGKEIGLVHRVCQRENIETEVNHFASELCLQTSGQAVAHTKKLLADISNMNLNDALTHAAQQNAFARSSDDCQKGIRAFLNKEELKW